MAANQTVFGEMWRNQLLGALPPATIDSIVHSFQQVAMPKGMVIAVSGKDPPYAYFPTSSVVSLCLETECGEATQIAMIGHEGMVGVSVFMGGSSAFNGVVIGPGMGFMIRRDALLQAFNQSSAVQSLLLRYTQCLMAQISQNAVCNRHHHLAQRLCSLLMLCSDRFQSYNFIITHEELAEMLGVRREGVTHAAFLLQEAGVLQYTRGHIKILDRHSLETRGCECYALVKAESIRLLSNQTNPMPLN
jgi:CRP-like cAMP-binding protein